MIKLNGKIINVEHFPDGTLKLNVDISNPLKVSRIIWYYENDSELITLMFLVNHIKDNYKDKSLDLYMPYIPNARMDRVHKKEIEVFTLKYFCEFINSLDFDNIYVLDAHSNVSIGMLNRCRQMNVGEYILDVLYEVRKIEIENINGLLVKDIVLYFPDAGAAKKYGDMFGGLFKYCYGEKIRDWETGKILGLKVNTNGFDLKDKIVLMVDDIISYGGSLFYSSKTLKELGVSKIYAYATHTENSILNREKGTLIKALENGTVERLFTTDSSFTGSHEKITVMETLL